MTQRKGIILAGGTGSRLHPSTISVSKQLMPVFDKPMIYYPLSVLMRSGLRDILIITTPQDEAAFRHLLGDGTRWGISLSYVCQARPEGIAQAMILAKDWLAGAAATLILGDNLFFGAEFDVRLKAAQALDQGATIFGYRVKDPARYGVIGFAGDGSVNSLTEKPDTPKSDFAVTGIYVFDGRAPHDAATLRPSARGELEITDLARTYLRRGDLRVEKLGSGNTWLDTGTHRSLLDAANFVAVIESRTGQRICCPEIEAFRQGWISAEALGDLSETLSKSGYGQYLREVARKTKDGP